MEFNIGDRVQIKSEYRKELTVPLGKRGQIGTIYTSFPDYSRIEWDNEQVTSHYTDKLTWHKQTKQHMPPKQYGNCYGTCVAHMLGTHINNVPKFENMFGKKYNWSLILAEWLWDHDVTVLEMKGHIKYPFPYMVSGPSPNFPDVYHCVVYQDGKMIFDPSHSNKGVLSEDYTTIFINIEQLTKIARKKGILNGR